VGTKRLWHSIALSGLVASCGGSGTSADTGATAGAGGATSGAGGSSSSSSASGGGSGGGVECPAGVICVSQFPFHHESDTKTAGKSQIDKYVCGTQNEGGPEIVYRVKLPENGFLSAAVYDAASVDVDVHLLKSFDPAAPSGSGCIARGDKHARADVSSGYAWIVADTFVGSSGAQPGAYSIDIGFTVPSHGKCGMAAGEMPRVGDGGNHLAMPATGPIVMEAHLVTQAEPPPYPMTATEELAAHYALSQTTTGFVMARSQVWAPLEGGSHYGAGIGSPTDFPVAHEAWYVNMYWTAQARPKKGTRMILRDPNGARAVVVAAGYETGPGNLAHIGGTPEETHFYMGTTHLSPMKIGIATDQSLPFGPRVCED
jgi:hypothetical protein